MFYGARSCSEREVHIGLKTDTPTPSHVKVAWNLHTRQRIAPELRRRCDDAVRSCAFALHSALHRYFLGRRGKFTVVECVRDDWELVLTVVHTIDCQWQDTIRIVLRGVTDEVVVVKYRFPDGSVGVGQLEYQEADTAHLVDEERPAFFEFHMINGQRPVSQTVWLGNA